jgi:hypothetical protein
MRATADSEGRITIALQRASASLSFKISGMDGAPFMPGAEIEISDARLNDAIEKLAAPFGLGPEDRVWDSMAN